jgi:hypothetical protein
MMMIIILIEISYVGQNVCRTKLLAVGQLIPVAPHRFVFIGIGIQVCIKLNVEF